MIVRTFCEIAFTNDFCFAGFSVIPDSVKSDQSIHSTNFVTISRHNSFVVYLAVKARLLHDKHELVEINFLAIAFIVEICYSEHHPDLFILDAFS